MDNSLRILLDALKKIIWQLKPQSNPLSFVVLTGKSGQGKSALLRQSQLEELTLFGENPAKVFYNSNGIIIELGETWLNQSNSLLKNTLKHLNRLHRSLQISGIILCIDSNELLNTEELQNEKNSHVQLLNRFTADLGYPVERFIIFTKIDTLAGFCEFYQGEHASDLKKSLGFSLKTPDQPKKLTEVFNQRFNQFIEVLGQKIINKLHPARSTIKRTLIREFPLQLLALRQPIQTIIYKSTASPSGLQAIYFTSAEQGGSSVDRLNKKIQHEYALTVQDTFSQAANYRPYFIEGALKAIQAQTAQLPPTMYLSYKTISMVLGSVTGLILIFLAINHIKTTHLLDETSKELLAYESLIHQKGDSAQALYHLSKAQDKVKHASASVLALPAISRLKNQLDTNTRIHMDRNFLPFLTRDLEDTINNTQQTPAARYKALKIYLMLAKPEHFSSEEVVHWFRNHWQSESVSSLAEKISLLKQVLVLPLQKFPINEQLINDTQNYFNALPASYFYYSLAKDYFSQDKHDIESDGFILTTKQLPAYYTKEGFHQVIQQLPEISQRIQKENWVISRSDAPQLTQALTEAYCYDYTAWWRTFLKHAQLPHFQNYQQGRELYKKLQDSNSIPKLIALVQSQTSPDFGESTSLFNEKIASQFTDLNLISQSSLKELGQTIAELEKFVTTISVINDEGRTAFTLTRGRFSDNKDSDSLSMLYNESKRLPDPIGLWAKQLADDLWTLLIQDTRGYINKQWQQTVYQDYETAIAHRYPLEASANDISLNDFTRFFAPQGLFNQFVINYLKPFLDTSSAQWEPKAVNEFMLPISNEMLDEIIRGNIISNMFFPDRNDECKIDFSLQKISLDPVVAHLELQIGDTQMSDSQDTDTITRFHWPQRNATLTLESIDGNHYQLAEKGLWGLFRLLEKVNVLENEKDSSSLQILFEINSNSGRYLLKTNNTVNPFTPGILNGFILKESIV